MGLRDYVKQISPPWLIGPGSGAVLPAAAGVAERFMYSLAFGLDALAQKVEDAIKMRFPGVGDPSALATIGDDRRITRGIGESDADYSERLRYWLVTWRWAGTARGVLSNVYAYVGVKPRTQVVLDGAGQSVWNYINQGADAFATPSTSHRVPKNWTWDAEVFVKRRWLIIDAANWLTTTFWITSNASWGNGGITWGDPFSMGFDALPAVLATLKTIVRQWQSADTRYQWIVVTYDGNLFPYNGAAGAATLPNSTWGHWSKIDATTTPARPCRVDSRTNMARYIAVDAPW